MILDKSVYGWDIIGHKNGQWEGRKLGSKGLIVRADSRDSLIELIWGSNEQSSYMS